MINCLRKYWLLIVIVALAFGLRVYKLGQIPAGMTWDEAAIGYNAFSILNTGRDEYGKLLPIVFKSFGDFKPGLFIYSTVPFVALFGLNVFATRLGSALAGTATVILVYFLVAKLFGDEKFKRLPPFSSLLLALSPWHIHFSRGAWEANFALMLSVASALCFLLLIEKKGLRQLLAFLFFIASSILSYHGAKIFLICFYCLLAIYFFKNIKIIIYKYKKVFYVVAPLVLALLLFSFIVSANRSKVMNVFSFRQPLGEIDGVVSQETLLPVVSKYLFHNELLFYARGIAGRYFNHFSGKFLFFEGDWTTSRHGAPHFGMMYPIEMIFFVLGLLGLIAHGNGLAIFLLLSWLMVSPIASALTKDALNGVRSLPMVVPLVIIASIGLNETVGWLKSNFKKFFIVTLIPIVMVYGYFVVMFLDLYFIHYPKIASQGWNYGMERVVKIINDSIGNKDNVFVTQKYGQPYIFYLFYSKYPPARYQKQAFLKENIYGDVGEVEKIDNIRFTNFYWPSDRLIKNSLFIGDSLQLPLKDIVPQEAFLSEEINFLNGKSAYRIVETIK